MTMGASKMPTHGGPSLCSRCGLPACECPADAKPLPRTPFGDAYDSLLAFRHGNPKHLTQEHARLLIDALNNSEEYNGKHQRACLYIEELCTALEATTKNLETLEGEYYREVGPGITGSIAENIAANRRTLAKRAATD